MDEPLDLPQLQETPPPPPPPPVLPESVMRLVVALAQRKIQGGHKDAIAFHLDPDTRDLVMTNTAVRVGTKPHDACNGTGCANCDGGRVPGNAYNVRFPAPPPHLHGNLDAIADFIHTVESHAPMIHNPPVPLEPQAERVPPEPAPGQEPAPP